MDDATLLRQFLTDRSEPAFAELVRRYLDLVWSSARRQTGSAELAEEVTQSVFILLAQKAHKIREGEAVGGWLLVTTRYTALNALRSEARRRKHERAAAAMKREEDHVEANKSMPTWEAISPLLDDAVAKLKREDRDALALRYFQGRSVADVAAALGVSQEVAQKRVSRAVERLRDLFARRGINTSADVLASALLANVLLVAPAALGTTVAGTALSAAGAAGSSLAAGKGAITLMAVANTKLVAAAAIGVVLMGVTGTIAYQQFSAPGNKTRQVRVDPAQMAALEQARERRILAPPIPVETWMPGFREKYGLKEGEIVKFVPRPWIPERIGFYRQESGESQYQSIPEGPDIMLIEDDGITFNQTRGMFGGPPTVTHSAEYVLGIEAWDLRGVDKLIRLPMRGDWVVRKGTTRQQRTAAFLAEVATANGATVRMSEQTIPRECIIIRGKLKAQPIVPVQPNQPPPIVFYRGKFDPKRSHGAGGGFADRIAGICDMPVIDEPGIKYNEVMVYTAPNAQITAKPGDPQRARRIEELLANLAAQTALEFKREMRTLPIWTLEAAK